MHLTHKAGLTLALFAVGGFVSMPAFAQDLVTNPGFETGDFTGWTTGPASDLEVVDILTSNNGSPHPPYDGLYCARFASSDPADDVLSQSIATNAGVSYTVSFWLAFDTSPFSAPVNDWKFSFGGNQLLDIEDAGGFPYTYHQFTVVATDAATLLTFSGRTPPGTFTLDDISVTDAGPAAVPEASSVASLGGLLMLGLGGLILGARRKKA